MADRRRNNGPIGVDTYAPIFVNAPTKGGSAPQRPKRTRGPNELRKIFLRTGITPTASGSAYLEIQPTASTTTTSTKTPTLKLTCAIHGPKPLPRSAPFSPNLVLTTSIKYSPFATAERKGYLKDSQERDLAAHLETALRGVVIGDRWPKCGADVVVTVLEAEEDGWHGVEREEGGGGGGKRRTAGASGNWGAMNVLAGCITVASAALVDAGIDCVDLVAGGMAASLAPDTVDNSAPELILDPSPIEHDNIAAACVVGYLPNRDEITELWYNGDTGSSLPADALVDGAVSASNATAGVLAEALREAAREKMKSGSEPIGGEGDVNMAD